MSNKLIAQALLEMADALETGHMGKRFKIGLTTLGSEHPESELLHAAQLAKGDLFDVVLIGSKNDLGLETHVVSSPEEGHKKMEELLDSGELDACVTMHYDFPIGVSTVGMVDTPSRAKRMILANTTGTAATNRVEAMVRNAVSGIAVAKSLGIENPKVGILNLDGAKQTEQILKKMAEAGFKIDFAESNRKDGGVSMRGNDLLQGTPDVMVTDSLTGNLLMKVFSSFNTGGDYEATGYGYGPGIGEGYDRKVYIISRASGAPTIAGAIRYAYMTLKGGLDKKIKETYKAANKVGYVDIIKSITEKKSAGGETKEVTAPPKEVCTGAIAGVDVMDLEDAVQYIWAAGIYAESGMGCTGPVVMVPEEKLQKALDLLKKGNFVV